MMMIVMLRNDVMMIMMMMMTMMMVMTMTMTLTMTMTAVMMMIVTVGNDDEHIKLRNPAFKPISSLQLLLIIRIQCSLT